MGLGTAAVATVAAAPDASAAPSCVSSTSGTYSPTDLNADAISDVVVGVPRATVSGRAHAGVVDVHYRASTADGAQRTQRFSESYFTGLPAAVADDGFGSSVAFTHLAPSASAPSGGDACADLVIGAPGANGGRGSVVIAQGSSTGVSHDDAIRLTGSTAGEQFGSTVVADGDDIWISAPERRVSNGRIGVYGAGAVDHYRVTDGTARLVQTLTEATPGIHGGPEDNDGFGRNLSVSASGPLVIGEPSEDVGASAVDAGSVTVVYSSRSTGLLTSSETYTQNSPGLPGVAERADHFGGSVSSVGTSGSATRIAVGLPGETLNNNHGAGSIETFTIKAGTATVTDAATLAQNSPGVPGANEPYDRFGKSVALTDGGLCVGVPGEDLGSVADAGDVLCHNLTGAASGPDPRWRVYSQGSSNPDTNLGGSAPQAGALAGEQVSRLAADGEGDAFSGGEGPVIAIPRQTLGGKTFSGGVWVGPQQSYTDSGGLGAYIYYGIPATAVSNGARYDTR